jgi:hypothetical protein
MSINSKNCDSKLLAKLELREFPKFMRRAVSSSPEFCHQSSTFNNLVAIGATKVCNYTERSGYKNRGPGSFSVHLQGRINHYFNNANSTDNSGGIGAFVFDNQSALAASASSRNLVPRTMDIIAKGIRKNRSIYTSGMTLYFLTQTMMTFQRTTGIARFVTHHTKSWIAKITTCVRQG